jgi:hypothetical protein
MPLLVVKEAFCFAYGTEEPRTLSYKPETIN